MNLKRKFFLAFCFCTSFFLFKTSLPGQLTGSSNTSTNKSCGTNMLDSPIQTSQSQTGENPLDYICNFSGIWPTCEPVTIPVYGIVAKTSTGLGPVTKQQYHFAISKLNASFSGTDFRFESMGVDTVWDDDLYDLELTDDAVQPETLLYRLFNEHGVRVFDSIKVRDNCSCSESKVRDMLSGLTVQERSESVESGQIQVACQFCSQDYSFDPDSFEVAS